MLLGQRGRAFMNVTSGPPGGARRGVMGKKMGGKRDTSSLHLKGRKKTQRRRRDKEPCPNVVQGDPNKGNQTNR